MTCGITDAGEVGFCAPHLAQMQGCSLSKVHMMKHRGHIEAQQGHLTCGTRNTSRMTVVPMGEVLRAEDNDWFRMQSP